MFFRNGRTRRGEALTCASDSAHPCGDKGSSSSPTQTDLRPARRTAHGQHDAVDPEATIDARKQPAMESVRGLRILLAEDHETNANLLIEELEHFGAQVAHALDGEIACTLLMSGADFDVILMDCQMPNLDGFEAARRIRSWEAQNRLPHVPIIALTGLSQEFEHERSCAVGMNGYLVKPFSAFQLAAAVQSAMRARRGVDALIA